jgi:hypothetical protein
LFRIPPSRLYYIVKQLNCYYADNG